MLLLYSCWALTMKALRIILFSLATASALFVATRVGAQNETKSLMDDGKIYREIDSLIHLLSNAHEDMDKKDILNKLLYKHLEGNHQSQDYGKQALQTAKLNNSRIIIFACIGGLALISMLTFYLFKSHRLKQRINEQLKDRVELKDLELSELIKLLQEEIEAHKKTQSRLEAINAELNNFMYRSSHDLKGPLASIIGITNIAKDSNSKKELFDYLNMISQSTGRLDVILETLVNAIRVADSPVEISLIDFVKFTTQIIKDLENPKHSKNVRIEIDADERLQLSTDKKLFITIMQNLIDNSLKYKKTTIEDSYVTIRAKKHGKGIRIIISDNGQGIPEDQQPKVFDMFVRSNLKSTGTGLGLYIVKKAVDKLDGSISLQSKRGIGTSFHLFIPDLRISASKGSLKSAYINN
ncbi:MAG: hypothetical protein COA57_00210 [Flavobacteriales bacterium]|nr:MAG: hypothetical protein COA57_00210 [Flavobacteriales bacterium]